MAGPTRVELLVGSNAFWERASADIARARRRVQVQAMTFEGDAAGRSVADAIAASAAADRRVLVDDYTRWMISDRFVWSPGALFDRGLRSEVRATVAMLNDLGNAGVGVRVTNPVGPLFIHYPARNHKKLIVADDVAYVGGINFSDHNFAWPDFMLRLEGRAAADVLAADFDATFAGSPRCWREDLGDLRLISMDGRDNESGFAGILALIGAARDEIIVISPYLTFPFIGVLAAAARRGVAVRLITPLANNKPIVRDAMLSAARPAGFEIHLLPAMTHLKGLLIDDSHLIAGSSNFDFVSVAAQEELMAVITDATVIEDFRRRIVDPLLSQALPVDSAPNPLFGGRASYLALKAAELLCRAAKRSPRTASVWRG